MPDITSNLDGSWPLQDNAATTTIVASVGSNGTLSTGTTAGITATGPGGSYPAALSFSGVNSTGPYITIAATPATANGPSTVACWFKASAQSSDAGSIIRPIWYSTSTSPAYSSIFRTGDANEGKLRETWYDGSSLVISSAQYIDSVWRHLAVTRNGTTVTTYINGVSISLSPTATNGTSLASLYIGGDASNAARRFAGSIAGVRVYSRELAAADVAALAALGTVIRVQSSGGIRELVGGMGG